MRRRAIGISNALFFTCCAVIGGSYVALIVLMLAADAAYVVEQSVPLKDASWTARVAANPVIQSLRDARIQYSIWLSMLSCTLSALTSLLVAVPMGYLMSRCRFRGRNLLDAVLDIPIVLPPLVVGLSLLILFQFAPFSWWARDIVYQVPAVILAQFAVACAFAVRTMKALAK